MYSIAMQTDTWCNFPKNNVALRRPVSVGTRHSYIHVYATAQNNAAQSGERHDNASVRSNLLSGVIVYLAGRINNLGPRTLDPLPCCYKSCDALDTGALEGAAYTPIRALLLARPLLQGVACSYKKHVNTKQHQQQQQKLLLSKIIDPRRPYTLPSTVLLLPSKHEKINTYMPTTAKHQITQNMPTTP